MGLFARFRQKEVVPEVSSSYSVNGMMGSFAKECEGPEFQMQLYAIAACLAVIALGRLFAEGRLKALKGYRLLDLSALNDASMCKEVVLAYLNAALLEPVLSIGGMEEVAGQELIINILTLGSICWWIWLITDAFEYTDVCQSFKYQ